MLEWTYSPLYVAPVEPTVPNSVECDNCVLPTSVTVFEISSDTLVDNSTIPKDTLADNSKSPLKNTSKKHQILSSIKSPFLKLVQVVRQNKADKEGVIQQLDEVLVAKPASKLKQRIKLFLVRPFQLPPVAQELI